MASVNVLETFGNAGEQALDTVIGGGAVALDVLRNPRRTRRRGAQANEAIARDAQAAVEDVVTLPERAFRAYLRALRRQARRKDVVGNVARGVLLSVNRPAGQAASFFERIERESHVEPRRRGRGGAVTRTRGAARTTARAATTTRRRNAQGRRTTTVARRGAGRRTAHR